MFRFVFSHLSVHTSFYLTFALMAVTYLKKEFTDGMVYYRIEPIKDPEDEYIYDATEIAVEDDTLSRDEFELTQEDLDEIHRDGFQAIAEAEFSKIESEQRSLDI